jgi:hypothetical protein
MRCSLWQAHSFGMTLEYATLLSAGVILQRDAFRKTKARIEPWVNKRVHVRNLAVPTFENMNAPRLHHAVSKVRHVLPKAWLAVGPHRQQAGAQTVKPRGLIKGSDIVGSLHPHRKRRHRQTAILVKQGNESVDIEFLKRLDVSVQEVMVKFPGGNRHLFGRKLGPVQCAPRPLQRTVDGSSRCL